MKSPATKSIIIILFLIGTFACHQKTKQPVKKVTSKNNQDSYYYDVNDTSPGIIVDTLYTNGGISIEKTKCSISSPNITPLPFGPKNNVHSARNYYSRLIYSNVGDLINDGWTPKALSRIKIYKLPLIKKINYIKVNNTDTDKCEDGKPFNNFFKINKYRYKLPDAGIYQCFYWCDYDPITPQYSPTVQQNCNWCIINFLYGYLVLYNPKTYEANVIAIYFDTYKDGSNHYRDFYIDKDYNITLINSSQEADDGDGKIASKLYTDKKIVVSIGKTGEIKIKK